MSEEAKPAGTVVVLRDGAELELLLLQRSPRDGKPGPWIFPGGKVEGVDRRGGAQPIDDARLASVREANEEAGLSLAEADLVSISRWVTPPISPKRFDTWFFLARVGADVPIRVDGQEICDHRWLTPGEALAAHHRSELRLPPPTFVTISWLAPFDDSATALRELDARPNIDFRPHITRTDGGACILYPGDAGYEALDPDRSGARHRLWTGREGWRYEWDGLA